MILKIFIPLCRSYFSYSRYLKSNNILHCDVLVQTGPMSPTELGHEDNYFSGQCQLFNALYTEVQGSHNYQ